MSGIVGLWNPDGRPADRDEISRMADAISHRGPDEKRIFVDGPAALGYLHLETRIRPLPVIQPYFDPGSGLSVVLDGRIDNRGELTIAIESYGLQARSNSDAELLLRAYQLWGVESPAKLLGDFAYAIWDSRHQRFFCARDQIGVKSFVYCHLQNFLFAFGSEINGIIALDRVPRRLNEFRLADYLVSELDREDTEGTFYQGIQRLPNGHFLTVERDSIKVVRYWHPPLKEGVRYRSIEEYGEAFRDLLMVATADRICNTDRIACAFSGGLDSGSVVAVARELSGGTSRANLPTFSLLADKSGIDLEVIHSVGEQGGIESHLVWPEDVTVENFDLATLIQRSNEPFDIDQGWFDWITYRWAHKHGFLVLLDGLDGDQMHPHPILIGSLLRTGYWSAAFKEARHLAENREWGFWKIFFRYGLAPVFPKAVQNLVRAKHLLARPAPDDSPEWIDADFALRTRVTERCAARRSRLVDAVRDPFLLHSLSFTKGLISFALDCFNTTASLAGLELRHPLADRRIAEFLISLPPELKINAPASKSIMRSAGRNLLPESVLIQRRLPHPGPAFHKRILDCHKEWLNSRIEFALHSLAGYINVDMLGKSLHSYESTEPDAGYALWIVAVLADWMELKKLNV